MLILTTCNAQTCLLCVMSQCGLSQRVWLYMKYLHIWCNACQVNRDVPKQGLCNIRMWSTCNQCVHASVGYTRFERCAYGITDMCDTMLIYTMWCVCFVAAGGFTSIIFFCLLSVNTTYQDGSSRSCLARMASYSTLPLWRLVYVLQHKYHGGPDHFGVYGGEPCCRPLCRSAACIHCERAQPKRYVAGWQPHSLTYCWLHVNCPSSSHTYRAIWRQSCVEGCVIRRHGRICAGGLLLRWLVGFTRVGDMLKLPHGWLVAE